jgi:hypothetical protein
MFEVDIFNILGASISFMFIFSAISKLSDLETFVFTLMHIPFLRIGWVRFIKFLVPVLELAIAWLLIFSPQCGGIIAITLLVVFSSIAWVAMRAEISIPCACFGGTSSEEYLSVKTIYRNVLMISLTLLYTLFVGEGATIVSFLLGSTVFVLFICFLKASENHRKLSSNTL